MPNDFSFPQCTHFQKKNKKQILGADLTLFSDFFNSTPTYRMELFIQFGFSSQIFK